MQQNDMKANLPKGKMPPFLKGKQNERPDPRAEARKGAAAKRLAMLKAKSKGK